MIETGNRIYFMDAEKQYLYFYRKSNGIIKGSFDESEQPYNKNEMAILEQLRGDDYCFNDLDN